MMYPVDYNIYGVGSSPVESFKKDDWGKWQKVFYVKDYLGSTRLEHRLDLDYQNLAYPGGTRYAWQDSEPLRTSVSYQANYAPYNDRLTGYVSRLSWLGKERDLESGYGDHGVRKYNSTAGRFMSVDPLWEKYISFSPYQYSGNNPVNALDVDGREIVWDPELSEAQKQMITDYFQMSSSLQVDWETMSEHENQVYITGNHTKFSKVNLKDKNVKNHYVDAIDGKKRTNKYIGGGGTNMYMSFNFKFLMYGRKADAAIVGHEGWHAIQGIFGDMREGKDNSITPNIEVDAMLHENLIRSELGLPLMDHYPSIDKNNNLQKMPIPLGSPVPVPEIILP